MNFYQHKPIYLQIADNLSDRILRGDWQGGQRIPSVRELGIELEVNPNTVMRTYDYLERSNIIYNKRGVGFFVAPEGEKIVRESRKREFMDYSLPEIFRIMNLIGVNIDEIVELYSNSKQEKG